MSTKIERLGAAAKAAARDDTSAFFKLVKAESELALEQENVAQLRAAANDALDAFNEALDALSSAVNEAKAEQQAAAEAQQEQDEAEFGAEYALNASINRRG